MSDVNPPATSYWPKGPELDAKTRDAIDASRLPPPDASDHDIQRYAHALMVLLEDCDNDVLKALCKRIDLCPCVLDGGKVGVHLNNLHWSYECPDDQTLEDMLMHAISYSADESTPGGIAELNAIRETLVKAVADIDAALTHDTPH